VVDLLAGLLSQVLGALLQSVFETAFGVTRDWTRHRRLASRLIAPDALLRQVEPAVAALRTGELAGLSDHEWQAAVHAVRDSFALVTPLEPPQDYRLIRDADALRGHVMARADELLRSSALSEPGLRAYRLLVAGCCTVLVNQVNTDSGLSALIQSMSLNDLDQANRQILLLLNRILGQQQTEELLFDRRYAHFVADTMRTFELFGVSSGRAPARYTFDDYYVSLALTRRDRELGDGNLTGAGTDGAHAISSSRRVLLQGGAGAGKTTFLTRLRLVAARGALTGGTAQWTDLLPFFVPLRRYQEREFPGLETLLDIEARPLLGERPNGWVSSVFRAGRGLLLVDGLDELTAERRIEALDWLAALIAAYPQARYVMSSRPAALDADWVDEHEFVTFDVLPLSEHGIRDFIHNWHTAARARESDPVEQAWLHTAESGLVATLSGRVELRKLAASPLLCGLICALHRQRNMTLPGDRRGLFDAALDLLLVRWDENRGIAAGDAWPRSIEEQLVLLQRFAYSMVANDEVVLARQRAVERFAAAIRGLRAASASSSDVLQQALERTGLLRETQADQIQFIHRSFRDYLAAREFVDAGLTGQLMTHVFEDNWREIIVMAVAHARPKERAELLQRLLDDAEALRKKDTRRADRLTLVAAVCLAEVQVIDPDEIRSRVQRAVGHLIPPATFDDADALARAGAFVLDLLPGPEGLTEAQAAMVVHTAARIGGEGAWAKIAPFTKLDHSMVIDELLYGWRLSDDPEEYARAVLAKVDFGDLRVPVRRWERVVALKHFTQVTAVRCIGDITPLDPLADIPNLRILELRANGVVRDLRPLAASRTLVELELLICDWLRDLSPLADTTIRALVLHRVDLAELDSLRGAHLDRLRIQHRDLAGGLLVLPETLPLRELILDNQGTSRSLTGIHRWPDLATVGLTGAPSADEVLTLAELPRLRRLVLSRVDPLDGLAELTAIPRWPALEVVELPDADEPTLRAARTILAEIADLDVRGPRPGH
jgi:hypothetical protein